MSRKRDLTLRWNRTMSAVSTGVGMTFEVTDGTADQVGRYARCLRLPPEAAREMAMQLLTMADSTERLSELPSARNVTRWELSDDGTEAKRVAR